MQSLTGKLLVATPQLRDPNFCQTVVFIIQHHEQGALGVVLNRPGKKFVPEVWKTIGKQASDSEQLVYVGGPMPGPLLAIHTHCSHADQEVISGLFVTAQENALDKLADDSMGDYRVYSGHAGWGEGQLDEELKAGGWLTTGANVEDIFSDHETLWKRMTTRIGLSILAPNLRPEQVPKDPSLN